MSPPRVVSLLPAATEIVCAFGLEELVVGRSHECDHPRSVRRLPACTTSRVNADASSRDIDGAVKELAKAGGPVFEVDAAQLKELRPDVILTQAHCDVCAVGPTDIERAVADWDGEAPEIVSIAPARFSQVWDCMFDIAEALDAVEAGGAQIKRLKGRVVDVIEKACSVKSKPSVACVEWIDPLMAAGNWVPDLVELAGGTNLFSESGKHSPWLEWTDFCEADPDVVVFMACGFGIERTRAELAVLTEKPEWASLKAVKAGRVYLADGNGYFTRPGPRLVDSLEMLAGMIHPEAFPAKFEGEAWERLGE